MIYLICMSFTAVIAMLLIIVRDNNKFIHQTKPEPCTVVFLNSQTGRSTK